jgi:hypothetical protein
VFVFENYFIYEIIFICIRGAIYLDIDLLLTVFDLSNTTYDSCAATFHGGNVFIHGQSLSTRITKRKFEYVSFVAPNGEEFYGQMKEDSTYESLTVYMSQDVVVYVDNSGEVAETCGSVGSPCGFYLFFFF